MKALSKQDRSVVAGGVGAFETSSACRWRDVVVADGEPPEKELDCASGG